MSDARWRSELVERRERGLTRSLRTVRSAQGPTVRLDGRDHINFGSNDYLSLASDERIREAVVRAVRDTGWGSGASRLVCGTHASHLELEERLAAFTGTERALAFSSGYLANLAAVRAGAGKGDLVFSDERNHASIIDGTRLSGARVIVYPHRDYDSLESLLRTRCRGGRKLIVTDSLFSVDGCFADLPRLVDLKERAGALLCVDEAHAFAVHGAKGRGVAEAQGVAGRIDITVGTLSKALGGVGGFVCGSQTLIDYLINTSRSFIFSTAPPPAACAAACAALDIVESAEGRQRREHALTLAARLRTKLADDRGYDISTTAGQVIPLIVGDADAALALCNQLLESGVFAPAFRPPSVPRGASCLRMSVTAGHDCEHIDTLIGALDEGQGAGQR